MGHLSAYVTQVVHSAYFKNVIMGCILLNTVTFAISASIALAEETETILTFLDCVDCCFLAIYTIEFIMKVYCLGRSYWFNGFNVFDFLILLFSHMQLILSKTGAKNLGVIKVMRSLRALRPLRSVSLIGGLQVVVTALIATLTGSFIHIISLLTILMFVYAIMAFYVYGYDPATPLIIEHWGTFGKSYLSLFVLMTAEGWTKVEKSLTNVESSFGVYFFLITFIFIGHFIFGNLFVAVVIEQIDKATAGYQKKIDVKKTTVILRKRNKAKNAQETEIKSLLDKQKSLDFKTFPRVVLDMYAHVRKDEFAMVDGTKGCVMWVQTLNQEYARLSSYNGMLCRYHREATNILGHLLNEMDESVHKMLMERAAEERILLGGDGKRSGFFRKLSRRTTLGSFRLPFVGSVNDESNGSENSSTVNRSWCGGCIAHLSTCRCINPELEARVEIEETEEDPDRRLSSLTQQWLNDRPRPTDNKRLSDTGAIARLKYPTRTLHPNWSDVP